MNKNDEKTYSNCYIAFLDILGFKELVKKSNCQEILDIFEDIKNPVSMISFGNKDRSNAQEIPASRQIKTKVMSDSICFYIDSQLPNSLFCLLACCATFQAKLLRRSTPILTRGAIVLGDIYAEGDITFGPGMTQAYLLEEGGAKYPRIIITKETLLKGLENISHPQFGRSINELIFCDIDKYYAVNWLTMFFGFSSFDENNSPIAYFKKILDHIEHTLSSTTDSSIRDKYLYLDKKTNDYKKCLEKQ